MRIGILGYGLDDPESIELTEIGRDLGHKTNLFVLDDVSCRPGTASNIDPLIAGETVSNFDIILSRAHIRPDFTQLDYDRYALLCHVEGVTVIDPADTYLDAESKFLGLQRLGAAGLPIAPTRSCSSVAEVEEALGEWDRIVLKPSFGLGGVDVERIYDMAEGRAKAEHLLLKYRQLVCQPYFPHPDGDVRVTIVGDRAPLVVSRVPTASSWKANVNMGATARSVLADPELVDISKRAAAAMGVTVAGLDFLPTQDGYRIVEFNNTPCWCFADEAERRHLVEAVFEVAEAIHNSPEHAGTHR
ncbi:RimK family alpha-L-glutamate ligase [Streptomyces lincolnensis]|uniref:RimK family alpha-L-glutamate ligase n=1 Tax=Streptomyces lincolnensis TaxID=1915 RepID=UPI0037D6B5D2